MVITDPLDVERGAAAEVSSGLDATEEDERGSGNIGDMVRRGSASLARASMEFLRYAAGEQEGEGELHGVADIEAGNNSLSLENPMTMERESESTRSRRVSFKERTSESFSLFDMLPISSKTLSPRSSSVKSTPREIVPTFRCGICLENNAETDRFLIDGCKESTHMFCSDCMDGYVRSQVEAAITVIACPGTSPGCSGIIGIDHIRKIVAGAGDEHLQEQLERFHAMNNNENFRECPKCNEPDITGSPENPEMQCVKCGEKYCYIHANAHPNMSCTQYAHNKLKEDRANLEFIEETTKECPACHAKTFKNGGCNHMTCVHCHADWCWLCNQQIGEGQGRGVTEHFSTGQCAGQQFHMTADGHADDEDTRILIYRCFDIRDPYAELSSVQRMICITMNNLLVGIINLCLCPCLIIASALACAMGCTYIWLVMPCYEGFRACLITTTGNDHDFPSHFDEDECC